MNPDKPEPAPKAGGEKAGSVTAAPAARGGPQPRRIAVVIPARNEAESIAAVVRGCREALAEYPAVRVVVADNASTDATAAAARDAGAEVVPASPVGYGAACLAAVAAVMGWADLLVFLDADGSSPPEEIPALLAPLTEGRTDLAIGYRTNPRHMTLPQRWGTRLAVALVNRLWGTTYRDMGPFRAVTAAAFRRLQMRDRTWGWTIEMQVRARQIGLRVVEVPVSWLPRATGRSKISGTVSGVLRAGARILWTIARLYFAKPGTTARRPPETEGSTAAGDLRNPTRSPHSSAPRRDNRA